MGKGITNYPNINAADADYLNGSIKDNTGAFNGTPFNALVYQDLHQTMAKFMRESVTTPNNLFDNESNGYQYYTAIRDLLAQHRKIYFKQGVASSTLIDADYSPLVIIKSGAAAGHVVSMQTPTGAFTGLITVTNYSANPVDCADQAGTNTINGAGLGINYALAAGRAVTFKLVAGNWAIQELRKL